jgi:hypothetical protein
MQPLPSWPLCYSAAQHNTAIHFPKQVLERLVTFFSGKTALHKLLAEKNIYIHLNADHYGHPLPLLLEVSVLMGISHLRSTWIVDAASCSGFSVSNCQCLTACISTFHLSANFST